MITLYKKSLLFLRQKSVISWLFKPKVNGNDLFFLQILLL